MNISSIIEKYIGHESSPKELSYKLGWDRYETFRRYYNDVSYPSLRMCKLMGEAYGFDFTKLYIEISELKAHNLKRKES